MFSMRLFDYSKVLFSFNKFWHHLGAILGKRRGPLSRFFSGSFRSTFGEFLSIFDCFLAPF